MNDKGNLSEILAECLDSGHYDSWDNFFRLVQPIVASAILRILNRSSAADSALADDLIQTVFVKLCDKDFRVLRHFRGDDENSLRAYLKTIANSVAIDHLRATPPVSPLAIDDLTGAVAFEDRIHQRVEAASILSHVEKCLASTEEPRRRIFWQYHRDRLKPRQIAELTDIGLGVSGVETLIYNLTLHVRKCLGKAGLLNSVISSQGGRA